MSSDTGGQSGMLTDNVADRYFMKKSSKKAIDGKRRTQSAVHDGKRRTQSAVRTAGDRVRSSVGGESR